MRELDWKNWTTFDVLSRSVQIFLGATAVWLIAHHLSTKLPSADKITNETMQVPEQTNLANQADIVRIEDGHQYRLQPKANYKIRGLVVATHNSRSLLDLAHRGSGNFYNSYDICVVWGQNAISSYLRDWKFTHGDFTCYVEMSSGESWRAFQKDQLSNTHILAENPQVLEVIGKAQIGDQIELSGQLIDYSMDETAKYKTSLIRDDTGPGACEILYTQEARLIARPPVLFFLIKAIARGGMALGLIGIFIAMVIMPMWRRRQIPQPRQDDEAA